MIDKKIIDFIKEHHVLTLATSKNNIPYCANMFYVFQEDQGTLLFTSEKITKHIEHVQENPIVAGSIVLETETIAKIQGLQFCGRMKELTGSDKVKAKLSYLKRFPYAILSDTPLWVIELTYMKLTDNRLGFGKKLIWELKE